VPLISEDGDGVSVYILCVQRSREPRVLAEGDAEVYPLRAAFTC